MGRGGELKTTAAHFHCTCPGPSMFYAFHMFKLPKFLKQHCGDRYNYHPQFIGEKTEATRG